MRTFIAALCATLLTACSTTKQLDPLALVNGAEGHTVTCQDAGDSTAGCYEKATAKCRSDGYKIVEARQMNPDQGAGRTLIFGCR